MQVGINMLKVNDFVKEFGYNNIAHGFRTSQLIKPTDLIVLIHSEVS